ncbi:hypothetical protein [Aequorivita viscosa]|uniref:Uncharacterized protein n=1 Tax=Aequorivita viscosa TaxID=797419 RepID=A0A1M6DIA1_9FLAO|nr:hypothetical protein [Aequorivita viscosa]SDW52510.1 hypothetical protein SAMN05216556_106151 [Aequorivita viscosa]SHI72912.1 hypothetical protein SAMN04487908_10521 [Aequorivita viscosa]
MKKKLREHLIMLANQILEKERTFETSSMRKLVIELHEKLTVLEYLENQLEDIPEVGHKESLDSKSFREENWFTEPEPVPQPEHKEDLIEPLMEKIKDIVAQMPEESERIDGLLDEMLPKSNKQTAVEEKVEEPAAEPIEKKVEEKKFTKNDLEEFAANYQTTPEFERKQVQQHTPPPTGTKTPSSNFTDTRKKSLNDTLNKGLNIGLNDRLAFIKHLFEGQTEDYTRVLSQINTLDNYEEAHSFINQKVKPDYNNWENKEEYSNRFMAIIERSFN